MGRAARIAPRRGIASERRGENRQRSEQLEFVAREADRKTLHGFDLAGRGAFYAARAEFIGALRIIAEALDTEQSADSHVRALNRALAAIREAEDFLPNGARLESDFDLPRTIATHSTPVLKTSAERVTSLTAMKCYMTFAQEQFAAAAGSEVAGSMALHALGKLYDALAAKQGASEPTAAPKAMVYYQAALLAYHENFMAANDLGVLLARSGNLKAARGMLEYSLSLSRQSTTLRNLAAVYRNTGEAALAGYVDNEAAWIEQAEIARNKYMRSIGDRSVHWLDPQTFAQVTTNSPYISPGRTPPPTQAAGQPVEPGRLPSANGPGKIADAKPTEELSAPRRRPTALAPAPAPRVSRKLDTYRY